jgi:hypothetical protein
MPLSLPNLLLIISHIIFFTISLLSISPIINENFKGVWIFIPIYAILYASQFFLKNKYRINTIFIILFFVGLLSKWIILYIDYWSGEIANIIVFKEGIIQLGGIAIFIACSASMTSICVGCFVIGDSFSGGPDEH